LSAAWRLIRSGVSDFELLELDSVPGGTSRGGGNSVSAYPWGAHYLPCPLPHARAVVELLVEMGAAARRPDGSLEFDEAALCRAPQERVFAFGRWEEGLYPHAGASADDERQLAAFKAEMRRFSEERDARGRRVFAVPAAHGSEDVADLDRLTIDAWMRARGYSSPRLRWYVGYACRDDFGATLEQTSAWAAIHYFASRQVSGRTQEVMTWPEGNARLVAHLARAAGPRVRPGVAVTRVSGGVVHCFEPRTGKVEALRADHVILAVPRGFASRLLGEQPDPIFQTGSWLAVNLTLSRPPLSRGFPQAWDNVLYDSPSLGYVVATHQQDLPPGRSVWTYYLPMLDHVPALGRKKLLSLTHAQICQAVIADLSRAHPDLTDCIERIDAWKWGHAMVRPSPGLFTSPARRAALGPRGRVHFAHADLSGLALFEEAQHHGVRAAEEILSARAIRFESLL